MKLTIYSLHFFFLFFKDKIQIVKKGGVCMYSYYSTLSTEVYDLDKPIGRSFGDVEFYKDRLRNCNGKILEPAVGTGRILIPLLHEGLDVDGMDVSPEMLGLCRAHCEFRGLSPLLVEGDMVSFHLPTSYEAIIIPTGSFLLIEDRKKSIAALKCFYEHLTEGGKFIVDLIIPAQLELGKSSTRSWETTKGEMITLEEKLVEVDVINQVTVSHLKYEKWVNKKLVQTELERFPLRWYGVEEFRLLLEKIGFTSITIFADYQMESTPTQHSQIISFEAHR